MPYFQKQKKPKVQIEAPAQKDLVMEKGSEMETDKMEIDNKRTEEGKWHDESESDDSDSDESDDEEAQRQYLNDMEKRIGVIKEWKTDKEFKKSKKAEERKRNQFPLTPRELAIATEMVTSKKNKRDLEELMYDKNSFNDPNELPEWFTTNEKRHRFRRLPEVDQNLVSMYSERQKAANVRTIKKVAEAKARKKRRFAKKAEKARKSAEGVLSQDDVSAREKESQIKRIYSKAGLKKNEKEKITYVPIKQGGGKRVPRPAGVKGKFKVVDSRMKTDMRAKKASERRQGLKPSKGRGLNVRNAKKSNKK